MKQILHNFIDFLFSAETASELLQVLIQVLLAFGIYFWQNDKLVHLGLFAFFFIISWVGYLRCKHSISSKRKELEKDNNDLHKQVAKYSMHNQMLVPLLDTLFDAQMAALHNEISIFVRDIIRTSVYMYEENKNFFHCFARHSSHSDYKEKNKRDKYPNKGWLQSTWNKGFYVFECKYTAPSDWIQKCKEECKANCLNTSCKSIPCTSTKKKKLPTRNCSMLSLEDLHKKKMKAKTVIGLVLKQETKNLGIILVECMGNLDDEQKQRIERLMKKYTNAALEILSTYGKQLLDLAEETETQVDIAENFRGGAYAK